MKEGIGERDTKKYIPSLVVVVGYITLVNARKGFHCGALTSLHKVVCIYSDKSGGGMKKNQEGRPTKKALTNIDDTTMAPKTQRGNII